MHSVIYHPCADVTEMSKKIASDSKQLKWGAKKLSLMVRAPSAMSSLVSCALIGAVQTIHAASGGGLVGCAAAARPILLEEVKVPSHIVCYSTSKRRIF